MSRQIIAIDVDEVLFPMLEGFTEWHNQLHSTTYTPAMFKTYKFSDTIQVAEAEAISRVRTFLSNGHAGVQPIYNAQDVIGRLSKEYTLVIVTARFPDLRGVTEEYIHSYFGPYISDIYMAGYPGDSYGVRPKVEICSEINAVALIDDSLRHISDCAGAGMQGVLFGDYSWNKHDGQLPEGVTRCADWNEVAGYFNV